MDDGGYELVPEHPNCRSDVPYASFVEYGTGPAAKSRVAPVVTQTRTPEEQAVALVRDQLGPLGDDLKDEGLRAVLATCRWDVGLALDAVLMRRRPEWVAKHIGPWPQPKV